MQQTGSPKLKPRAPFAVNVHPASLSALLCQTLPITQHLACTFIFISIFIRLSRGSLQPPQLLALSTVLGVGCRVWSSLLLDSEDDASARAANGDTGQRSSSDSSPAASSSIVAPLIPLFTLYLLSPALKTLTKATTSDSIWALSGTLFCVNLFLGDYRAIPSTYRRKRRVGPSPSHSTTPLSSPSAMSTAPSTLPLTAALSGSTVLASRLDENLAVFSLLLFATLWFGPWPLLRSDLPLKPTLFLTCACCVTALLSLKGLGGGAVGIAAMMMMGTSVVAPVGRGWLGVRYKDRVRGPWDQAVPRV